MSHATHANAALTPRARLRLARLVVDRGWTPARAAERYAQKHRGRGIYAIHDVLDRILFGDDSALAIAAVVAIKARREHLIALAPRLF